MIVATVTTSASVLALAVYWCHDPYSPLEAVGEVEAKEVRARFGRNGWALAVPGGRFKANVLYHDGVRVSDEGDTRHVWTAPGTGGEE